MPASHDPAARVPPQTAVGRKKAEPFNFLPADVK